jgi:hypothetical protein
MVGPPLHAAPVTASQNGWHSPVAVVPPEPPAPPELVPPPPLTPPLPAAAPPDPAVPAAPPELVPPLEVPPVAWVFSVLLPQAPKVVSNAIK